MASYKVTSDLVDGKKAGDAITEEELEGCNIEALLEAGHIVGAKPTKEKEQ